MRPQIPSTVDGVPLTSGPTETLSKLVDSIWGVDHLRSADVILSIALRGFRKMWKVVDGRWVPVAVISLGTGPADAKIVA